MIWKSLISEDKRNASMSRVGTWLSFIVMSVATILYFINIIESETYKNIVVEWKNIFLIFIGYQGVSKVSKHKYKKDEVDKDE